MQEKFPAQDAIELLIRWLKETGEDLLGKVYVGSTELKPLLKAKKRAALNELMSGVLQAMFMNRGGQLAQGVVIHEFASVGVDDNPCQGNELHLLIWRTVRSLEGSLGGWRLHHAVLPFCLGREAVGWEADSD